MAGSEQHGSKEENFVKGVKYWIDTLIHQFMYEYQFDDHVEKLSEVNLLYNELLYGMLNVSHMTNDTNHLVVCNMRNILWITDHLDIILQHVSSSLRAMFSNHAVVTRHKEILKIYGVICYTQIAVNGHNTSRHQWIWIM